MGTTSQQVEYRLVGVGRWTKGLKHLLKPGDPVVIGRHSACSIVLTSGPNPNSDLDAISRQHAVIEEDPKQGWRIRDNGSVNGTALLRGGFPPAMKLSAGVYEQLQDSDVIEFAETDQFSLEYQVISTGEEIRNPTVESHTHKLIASNSLCLQLVYKGAARQVAELDERGISIGRGNPQAKSSPEIWLEIPGLEENHCYGTVALENGAAVLHCEDSLLLNLKTIRPGKKVTLTDGDLLTIEDRPELSLIFLDPKTIRPRNLSDLLAGTDRITVGTSEQNSCRVIHPSLSREHAIIWREGGKLFIQDLHTTNGTTVNGQRIQDAATLNPGATFSLGRLPFLADPDCWAATVAPGTVDVRFVKVSVEIAGKLRLRGVSFSAGQR